MSDITASVTDNPRWDFWLKHFFQGALIGVTAGQWLFMLTEMWFPLGLSVLQAALFCSVYVPVVVTPLAMYLAWRRHMLTAPFLPPARQTDLGWTLLGVASFAVWSTSYFLIAQFVEGRPMATFPTYVERHIPFAPAATMVYLTVYWFVMLPFFSMRDQVPFRKMAAAYATVLGVCLFAFMLYPVTMERPTVEVMDLFTFAIGTTYSVDPPHNCFPSSHCAMAMMSALVYFEIDRRLGFVAVAYACIIGITTLLTKQHYVADVLAGFAVSGTVYWAYFRTKVLEQYFDSHAEQGA